MRPSLTHVGRSVALVIGLGLLLAAPVAARESVDPNTLNPPPPASFNATCERTGHRIVCNLAFSDPPLVMEPSGVVCDGTELLVSQTRDVVGKRFYDADGNLTRRHFREVFDGTITNPSSGITLAWVAHNTIIHDLAVPGEIASGHTSITGQQMRIYGTNGTVLVDVGHLVVDEATGELLKSSGKHAFDDYFINGNTAALAPLCDAIS
jgi:hypothetical protein